MAAARGGRCRAGEPGGTGGRAGGGDGARRGGVGAEPQADRPDRRDRGGVTPRGRGVQPGCGGQPGTEVLAPGRGVGLRAGRGGGRGDDRGRPDERPRGGRGEPENNLLSEWL